MPQPDFGSNLDDDAVMPMARSEPAVVSMPPVNDKPAPRMVGPRVRIVLEDNDNIPPTGQFFGHNGRGFILKSGEAADVPPEIINILNDAVWEAPIVDPMTRQITGYRKRLRFPYRVLGALQEA